MQHVVTPSERPDPKKSSAQHTTTNALLCGATYPATPSSANPTIGSPHANAYTFSRLIFAAIFGKHKSPTISAMIANPKIEYRYSSWHTHLK